MNCKQTIFKSNRLGVNVIVLVDCCGCCGWCCCCCCCCLLIRVVVFAVVVLLKGWSVGQLLSSLVPWFVGSLVRFFVFGFVSNVCVFFKTFFLYTKQKHANFIFISLLVMFVFVFSFLVTFLVVCQNTIVYVTKKTLKGCSPAGLQVRVKSKGIPLMRRPSCS